MGVLGIFIIALIMSFAFSPYRKNNPVAPLIILFFILLLSGIAAQYWIIPFGPRGLGVSWLPVLLIMFVFGLLFSSSPTGRRQRKAAAQQQAEQQSEASTAIGIFIWIILFVLLCAVIAGMYLTPGAAVV